MSRTYKDSPINVSRRQRMTRHHIHPRGSGGGNEPENIVALDERFHRALHDTFGAMPPHQYFAALNSDPMRYARKIVMVLIRHFGIGVLNALSHRERQSIQRTSL